MKVGIELNVRQTGNGFEVVSAGLSKVGKDAEGSIGGVNNLMGAVGKLAGAVGAVAIAYKTFDVLKDLTVKGIMFNAEMESSRLGLAAIIGQFGEIRSQGGPAITGLTANLVMATRMQEKLKIAALQTTASYQDMARALQTSMAPALKAGFNEDQVITFTRTVAQAWGAMGRPMEMLGQEVRALFSGDIGPDSELANMLFTDMPRDKIKAYVEELKRTGTFFDEMMKRMHSFAEAGAEAGNTFSGALSNLQDAIGQALGKATEAQFSNVTQLIKDLTAQIVTFDDKSRAIWNQDLLDGLGTVAEGFVKVAGFIVGAIEKLNLFIDKLGAVDDLLLGRKEDKGSRWKGRRSPFAINFKEYNPFLSKAEREKLEEERTPNRSFEEALGLRQRDRKNKNMARASRGPDALLLEMMESGNLGTAAALADEEFKRGWSLTGKRGNVTDPDAAKKQRELAKAIREAAEEHTRILDKERARVRSAADLIASTEGFIDAQRRSLEVSEEERAGIRTDIDIMGIRAELEEASSALSGKHAGALQKQLAIRVRLNAAEASKAGVETRQRETAEVARHMDALRDIEKKQQELNEKADEWWTTGDAGLNPEEAARQQELINAARSAEDDQHRSATLKNEELTEQQKTQLALSHMRERNNLLRAIFEEENEKLISIYEGTNQAMLSGLRNLFENGDLEAGFGALVDGMKGTWADAMAGMASQYLDMLKTSATGTPWQETSPGQWERTLPNKNAKAGYMGVQAAGAMYGLYQQGQAGMTPGEGAMQGMMAGASIGAMAGPIGAAVGLIIGGIFGALMGKEKVGLRVTSVNGKLTVTGGGSASAGDLEDAMRGINVMIADTRADMLGLLEAFPAEMLATLTTQLGEVSQGDIFGNFDIGQQRWKNWLAKQFGSLGKAMRGMLSPEEFKRWTEKDLPEMMFDAYAPIIAGGLKELGVVDAKIKELLEKAPGFDAKEALKKLTEYVTVLVGFVEMDEFNRLTQSDLMNRAKTTIGETQINGIVRMGEELKKLTVNFDQLSTDEQVKRGEKILELETQRQQAVLQYLYEIQRVQEQMFKAIDRQISDIGFGEMGPLAQRGSMQGRLAEISASILTAATPQQLAELGSEYQQLVQSIYDSTVAMIADLTQLSDSFKALDELLMPEQSPFERLAALQAKIGDAHQRMVNASNPDDALKAARELYGLAEERYRLERAMLDEITATIQGINETLDDTIANFSLESRVTAAEARGASPEDIANLRIDDLTARQRTLRDQLSTASSAEEINRIVSEMNENANMLFNLMGRTPEAAAQLTGMLEDVRTIAKDKLLALAEAIGAEDAANRQRVTDATTFLQTELGKLEGAATAATDALTALKDQLATRFTELADAVIAANTDLLDVIGDILERLRTGLDGVFGEQTTDPGTNTPGTGDPYVPVQQPLNIIIGTPVVTVTVAGTAEPLIDSVIAEAEMRGAQRAVSAVATFASRQAGGF